MANSKEKCPKFDVCGGCTYQEIDYNEQLNIKLANAKASLIENGIDDSILREIVPSPSIYNYRNKMEYTFGDEVIGGPMNLGMHKLGSYISIIDCGQCQLVPEDFNTILNLTKEWCISKGYNFYHKKRHDGLLRSLIIRKGFRTDELLINIVTSSEIEFAEEEYKNLLLSTSLDSHIVGILHTINDNVADALVVDDCRILYGQDYYTEEILGLKFKVGAFSFFQSNVVAAERLYKEALALLPGLEGKIVYDLYCGTGTISQAMALKAKKVFGVEIVEDAVNSAKNNAEINHLDNCDFICGDVLKVLDDISEKPDVIVVDPPRAGIHPKAMKKICNYDIPEILYISCNPKTLAINLAQAAEYGYKSVSMKCFDNFAFTKHTEAICVLKKL
ncbi:MAG: 23S rRNA (uracil(1939)-C(5))-methyltransferase RlmD [Bacillota bacterium]|nr:23S rRNA (uracil(1939)-C(5))-methyltransferase RlmD [Bacillota bacterium]